MEYVTWDYSEDLILDRNTETLEHTQQIGTECSVNRKYHVQDGVSSFLDDLDADELFANIAGNPEDAVYNPMNRKDYTITIDYKKEPQKIISGTFDKNGLPDDYESFIDDVWDFIEFYGAGEIFSSSIYSRPLRRKDELIFCSVIFEDGGKTYYYLTDDDSLEVGDIVTVPAGLDNHEASAQIVGIEYFSPDKAPLPLEKVKRIIRKGED